MDPGVKRFWKSPPKESGHKWISGNRGAVKGVKGEIQKEIFSQNFHFLLRNGKLICGSLQTILLCLVRELAGG